MSFSLNNNPYSSLNLESFTNNNKSFSTNGSNYYLSLPAHTPTSEYLHPIDYKETDFSIKKEITHLSPYLVKIEQYPDYYTDNSHYNLTNMNSDDTSLDYNLFAENSNMLQQLSPRLSYPDQPLLNLGYDGIQNSFDYFMSESPTASYSLSPPPTLSPELQPIGPSYCDTIEQNNKCNNYHYAALNYPSVETEISGCCNLSDNFIYNSSTTHDFTLEEHKNDNINNEENNTSFNSTACSVASSTGDEVAITKKIYPCNFCNRSFARKYDVARHKRIHTGSKPYVCPHCLKGFSRSDARVRHFRTEIACRDGADKLGRHRTQKLNSSTMNKQ